MEREYTFSVRINAVDQDIAVEVLQVALGAAKDREEIDDFDISEGE